MKLDLSGKPMRSYGNTGTPVTMDMGCFKIYYREPHCGGNRMFLSAHTATMMDAVAEFNLLKGGFDTPLRIERYDTFGNHSHTWTMDARYAVPRQHRDTVRYRRTKSRNRSWRRS